MNSTSESHPSLGSPAFFFLECSTWLVLFILGRPLEFYFDVKLPHGLQLQPNIMERLSGLFYKIWQRQLAIGDEVIWWNCGIMKQSEPNFLSRPKKIRGEGFIPFWIICLPLGAGSLNIQLININGNIWVKLRLLGCVFVKVKAGHEAGWLEPWACTYCHLEIFWIVKYRFKTFFRMKSEVHVIISLVCLFRRFFNQSSEFLWMQK